MPSQIRCDLHICTMADQIRAANGGILQSAKAAKAGTPPDLKRLKTLASMSRGGVLIAIIFAVTVFN